MRTHALTRPRPQGRQVIGHELVTHGVVVGPVIAGSWKGLTKPRSRDHQGDSRPERLRPPGPLCAPVLPQAGQRVLFGHGLGTNFWAPANTRSHARYKRGPWGEYKAF